MSKELVSDERGNFHYGDPSLPRLEEGISCVGGHADTGR